jgi:hypothetical protein
MTLQRIVGALLPQEQREQVLGDLHERGFLLRDVLNVLPRVWWSYLVREFSGPVPALARACESAIAARTQKLSLHGRIVTAIAFGGLATSDNFLMRGSAWPAIGVAIAWFAALTWAEKRKSPISVLPDNRPKLLTRYLEELDRQIDSCKWRAVGMLLYILLQATFRHSPLPAFPVAVLYSGLFLILAVDRLRLTRLRAEFRSLTNPTPAR